VGLSKGVVYGQRIYESIENIDRDIGLAVILTPPRRFRASWNMRPQGNQACGHRIRRLFRLGKEGEPLEKACVEVARRYGIRFIGPNGIGSPISITA